MPPPKTSPQLLDKYLRNQVTQEERELVEAWYASLAGNPDYLGSLSEHKQQQLQEETLLNIQDKLRTSRRQTTVQLLSFRRLSGLAATICLALGLYSAYRYVASQKTTSNDVSNSTSVTKAILKESTHFTNRALRPVRHPLPDGSSVWMHPGATIIYPNRFDSGRRLVTFSGEGFFVIKKDYSRPFLIQSGLMQVKVLGTSFNVRAPTEHRVFQVSVVTGRVVVSAPDRQQKQQQVVLTPRQQAIFETESQRLVFAPISSESRKEIFEPVSVVFDNVPLHQAIEQLQKRFNLQIKLANPGLATCRVSADFEQQPLPLIMDMLCAALDATYTLSGNTIVMDGLPCE